MKLNRAHFRAIIFYDCWIRFDFWWWSTISSDPVSLVFRIQSCSHFCTGRLVWRLSKIGCCGRSHHQRSTKLNRTAQNVQWQSDIQDMIVLLSLRLSLNVTCSDCDWCGGLFTTVHSSHNSFNSLIVWLTNSRPLLFCKVECLKS